MRLLAASSLSVCLSVRMEELDSHRADVRENLYWGFLMVFIETYRFLWNWDKNIGPTNIYEGWNFNSGNYLFTTDTK